MPTPPLREAVRRDRARPSRLHAPWRHEPQGLPGRRTAVAVCAAAAATGRMIDRLTATVTLFHQLWWPRENAVFFRQTGNSGAIPGRPRRCDQATRSAVSSHCGAAPSGLAARRHAAGRAWESEDLPRVGVRRTARAEWRARCRGFVPRRPVFRLRGFTAAGTRFAPGTCAFRHARSGGRACAGSVAFAWIRIRGHRVAA